MAKFKIGDRVVCIRENGSVHVGMEGVVLEVDRKGCFDMEIAFAGVTDLCDYGDVALVVEAPVKPAADAALEYLKARLEELPHHAMSRNTPQAAAHQTLTHMLATVYGLRVNPNLTFVEIA